MNEVAQNLINTTITLCGLIFANADLEKFRVD